MVALATVACAGIEHNDVLIFGTNTKLALDVSSSAVAAGTPQITLGYKREEAVWMPLVVNAKGVDPRFVPTCVTGQPCPVPMTGFKYMGSAEQQSQHGGGTDAYSVFASFGANIKGDGRADNVSAGVGLAQFFATGIAAQRLAQNSQVVSALSLHGAQAGRVAEAAATATQANAGVAIARAIGAENATKNTTLAEKLQACRVLKEVELSTLVTVTDDDLRNRMLQDVDASPNAAALSGVIATHRPDYQADFDAMLAACTR